MESWGSNWFDGPRKDSQLLELVEISVAAVMVVLRRLSRNQWLRMGLRL
jgi:hypothetical protein